MGVFAWTGRALGRGAALGLLISSLCGCGGGSGDIVDKRPTGKISGIVTYKGEPVTDATVLFEDGKTGTTKGSDLGADGKFTIAGVPAADYKVFVVPKPPPFTPSPDDPAKKPPEPNPSNIPPKYRAADSSRFTATVKEGQDNDFKFNMEG